MTYVLVNPLLSENTHFKNEQCIFEMLWYHEPGIQKYQRVLTLNE